MQKKCLYHSRCSQLWSQETGGLQGRLVCSSDRSKLRLYLSRWLPAQHKNKQKGRPAHSDLNAKKKQVIWSKLEKVQYNSQPLLDLEITLLHQILTCLDSSRQLGGCLPEKRDMGRKHWKRPLNVCPILHSYLFFCFLTSPKKPWQHNPCHCPQVPFCQWFSTKEQVQWDLSITKKLFQSHFMKEREKAKRFSQEEKKKQY